MKKIFLLSAVAVLAVVSLAGCAKTVDPATGTGASYVQACLKAGGETWTGNVPFKHGTAPGLFDDGITACIFPYPTLPKGN